MNANLNLKIFFLFACLCAFASVIAAQTVKPEAVLLDKITGAEIKYAANFDYVMENVEKALAKEPKTTRIHFAEPINTKLGKRLLLAAEKNSALTNRIRFMGNLKHPERYDIPSSDSEVEIYLIPQGAKIPVREICEVVECPYLHIIAPETVDNKTVVLTFTAEAKGGDDDIKLFKYQWTVSAGKIVEGQGTSTIKVDATGAKEVTAKFEIIENLEIDCPNEATFTTKIQ